MSFQLPNFNLKCNVWHLPNTPPTNPPDANFDCNLAYSRRVHEGAGGLTSLMSLLLPAGTDIRSIVNHAAGPDFVEVPAGTGRYYRVTEVDDAGKGFDNEHRVALIQQDGTGALLWPTPMP